MSDEIRQLVVDGTPYGWRVTHRHRPDASKPGERICVDQFMAFRPGSKNAPLRISFAGASLERHGMLRIPSPDIILNLHRPRTAAALIRAAVEFGWSAETPMVVEDGLSFVSALPAGVQDDIAEPGAASIHSSSPEGASAESLGRQPQEKAVAPSGLVRAGRGEFRRQDRRFAPRDIFSSDMTFLYGMVGEMQGSHAILYPERPFPGARP